MDKWLLENRKNQFGFVALLLSILWSKVTGQLYYRNAPSGHQDAVLCQQSTSLPQVSIECSNSCTVNSEESPNLMNICISFQCRFLKICRLVKVC
jgi:hypothetical protein